jgi:hypothetical protein
MRTQLFLPAAALLLAASCSTGPQPPQPGTPAFLWNAAKSTWHSGDFVKTGETLQQLAKSESEFTARSRPWSILVASGLAQGYAATADAYLYGEKANRQNPVPFHKEANQLRSMATAAALQFAEEVHIFLDKDKAPNVALAFEFPAGGAGEPPAMRKITSGAWLQDSERESLLSQMLQRGVVHSVSSAVGSPDDTPKAAELFKTPDVQRPRADFLVAVAKELYDRSDLFTATKLDNPARLRVLCQEALQALEGVPESKDSKALTTKIQAALKKIKGTT